MKNSPWTNFRATLGIGAILGLAFTGGFYAQRTVFTQDPPVAATPVGTPRTGAGPPLDQELSCEDETAPLHLELDALRKNVLKSRKDLDALKGELLKVRKRLAVREIDVSNLQVWLAERDGEVKRLRRKGDAGCYEVAP